MADLKPGSTVAAHSALRAISAQRQLDALALKGRAGRAGEGPWKGLTAEAIRRARAQLELRRGKLYDAIRRGRGAASMRHIREDGRTNLDAILVVLLAHADRKTGWIGDPRRRNVPWQLDELFLRCFGPAVPNELAMDRMWGWIRVLKSCGLLQVLERATTTPVGDRAVSAIKFLTHRFFDLLGLASQMAIHQRLDKMHAQPRAARPPREEAQPTPARSGLQRPQSLADVLAGAAPSPALRAIDKPPGHAHRPTAPPPDVPVDGGPADHIAYLKALLERP